MQAFKLNNFRCFLDQEFAFSKVNILIGENSAGKSSLLKFFVALAESLSNSPRELNLALNTSKVDLGNFREVVHYNDESKNIEFEFEVPKDRLKSLTLSIITVLVYDFHNQAVDQEDENVSVAWIKEDIGKKLGDAFDAPTRIGFSLTKDLGDHSSIRTTISNPKLGVLNIIQKPQGKDPANLGSIKCSLEYTRVDGTRHLIETASCTKQAFLSIVEGQAVCNFYGQQNKMHIFYEMGLLLISQNCVEEFLERLDYINPIGSKPARLYFRKDRRSQIQAVSTIEDLVYTLEMLDENLVAQFSTVLTEFGIVDGIRVSRETAVPVIEIKSLVKDLWSNLLDVGYGVSLQLPIIFNAFITNALDPGRTMLVEQPEVHLHPKLQAQFIDTLAKMTNNRYFIETHSEHIVRKLQLLVKEQRYGLKADDVTVHYFKRVEQKAMVTRHKIEANGRLTPPMPKGFYDVSYELAKGLLD